MFIINRRRAFAAIRRRRSAGFSIFELALTLAIMAALTGAVLVPFVAQITQRNVSATEKLLDDAKEALLGFASATGRLPCPATINSNGAEAFLAGSSAGDGKCAQTHGYLPAATLGLPNVDNQGFAVDAWGAAKEHRIRYAVWNDPVAPAGVTNNNPFTKTDGMRMATPGAMAAAKMFYVCPGGLGVTAGTDCGSQVKLTDNAPVLIWSPGANAATTGGVSADEVQNPNPKNENSADRIFVSRTRVDVAGSEFDDVVTWIPVGNLVSRMVLGGMLP